MKTKEDTTENGKDATQQHLPVVTKKNNLTAFLPRGMRFFLFVLTEAPRITENKINLTRFIKVIRRVYVGIVDFTGRELRIVGWVVEKVGKYEEVEDEKTICALIIAFLLNNCATLVKKTQPEK